MSSALINVFFSVQYGIAKKVYLFVNQELIHYECYVFRDNQNQPRRKMQKLTANG